MEADIDKGSCAFAAIKKNIVRMNRGVIIGQTPAELYARDLIDDNTWELCLSPITDGEKGKKIAREVQQRVRLFPEMMDILCEILKKERTTEDLAEAIQATYKAKLEEALEKSQSRFGFDFENLKEELEQHKSDLALPDAPLNELDTLIKFKVESFIKTSVESGVTKIDLYRKLHLLCYETFTIPPRLCDWVLETLEKNTATKPKPPVSEASSSQVAKREAVPEPLPPLPTPELKDLIYNSSLCCQAVSSCTIANYKKFFSEKNSRHKFEEISMSISEDREEVDRYLIATQGQTIYVAFQSEPTIQKWMEDFSSFSEGLKKQSRRIPFIFFWEQLREQKKRIILTGFSFGAMLACFVAAVLWKESCISIDALEKNVVCITYGQPLIRIPFVQQVIKDFPRFQDTIYCVFEMDDLFPTVLRYYSCTQYTSSRGNLTALSTPTSTSSGCCSTSLDESQDLGNEQTFKEHGVSHRFLSDLSLLQKPEVSYSTVTTSGAATDQSRESDALNRIRQDLTEILPHVKSDEGLLCGRYCFQIAQKEGQGLVWTKTPSKEHASQMLGSIPKIVVDSLQLTSFSKHNMDEYQTKMVKSFLLKDPEKFSLPPPQTDKFKEVSRLKPNVTGVAVHIFPNEHAVVLEGENLSFCNEVQLGENSNVLKIKSPDHVSTRVIQFNCPPNKKTRSINISDDGAMKVTLRSHFSNPIRKRIKVNKESFTFSLREIQLAKYTPSEVIQLAFMSAMLERYSNQPSEQGPSQRLKHVTHFLEEAVKVVPLESIFSAVAYMDDSSAVECAKAIVASKFKFPVSEAICCASQLAEVRMKSGIHGALLEGYIQRVIRQTSHLVPSRKGNYDVQLNYCSTDDVLEVSVLTPGPAPFTYAESILQGLVPPFTLPGITLKIPVDRKSVPQGKRYPPSAPFFRNIVKEAVDMKTKSPGSVNELSNFSIEHIYPINSQRRHSMTVTTLKSPLDILHEARQSLQAFMEDNNDESDSSQHLTNEKMLELVKDIFDNKVGICATLLGAFMEQQIKIPLLKESEKSTADLLSSKSAPVAMGVWALFSSTFQELHDMLALMRGNPLVVEIADYIAGVLSDDLKKKKSRQGSKYDGKLQFLLQACSKRRITCSSEYVSYSLEHQLCSKPKFNKSISVKELIEKWDKTFKGDALSLVAASHRPLIARWLKWAVLIHDLRLSLASYTCVGVTGLVNSGKSQFIKKLFGIQTQVGTLEKTRTTVPLLYNLDGIVDGLDVIDFPGVDDKENNVPKLAEMLLGLAQVVVFVCDHKRIFTDQAKQWLQQLQKQDVPVILCLTFADELYLHFIAEDKGNADPTEFKRREIGRELERKLEKIGYHASRKVGFYCFHVPAGYLAQVNVENLKKMGIGTPQDVGHELVNIFSKTLKQKDVAKELQDHIEKLQADF